MLKTAAQIFALVLLCACQSEQSSVSTEKDSVDDDAVEVLHATASMKDADGNDIGTVDLGSSADQLFLDLKLGGIPPGTKAFHLHTTGACDGPDFKSAGGHLNPAGNTHGKLSEGGKHLGDLPNLEVTESGQFVTRIAFDTEHDTALLAMDDDDGTAVMIHAGPDDYVSDPAGAAGPRIACGVLSFSR